MAKIFLFFTLLVVTAAVPNVTKFTETILDAQGREITPFMRKHGLTHESGWGPKAGLLNGKPLPVGLPLDNCGKLSGFFVMECQAYATIQGQPVSRVQTRHYHEEDFTYEIDSTYYIGDKDCTPNDSDVYYKTLMNGVIDYHGPNKVFPGATMASLNWTSGTYQFGDNPYGRRLVDNLNQYCACGGKWEVGVERSVKESQCALPVDPKAMNPCNIISGQVDYFNYQHKPDCNHYETSKDCFTDPVTCWNNPIDGGFIREKIPESGNNHASDCDYQLWHDCGAGIKLADENCQSCVGLECDGCLFREMNPNWNPKTHDVDDWYKCCPCIYNYAEKYDKKWMSTLC